MEHTVVVVTGGAPPHPGVVERLPHPVTVVAADSGLDHALTLGLPVDVVVGDLDSVSARALAEAEDAGIPVERHATDKDAVDTELAIAAALARGAERLVVVAGAGDRLDHLLASLALLTQPALRGVRVEAYVGEAHAVALQGPGVVELDGAAGELVSLLPAHGNAQGVTTAGLRFPLTGETLVSWASRGVSNVLLGGTATVQLERGALLVVRPFALRGGA